MPARRTRHLSDAFPNSTPHPDYANLSEWVLVKPFRDEFPCILKHEVKARRAHVAIHHRGGEVEHEDEVPDDGPSYSSCRGKQTEQMNTRGDDRDVCTLTVSACLSQSGPGQSSGDCPSHPPGQHPMYARTTLPMHTVARSTKYHLNYAPAGFGRGQHTSLALPLPLSPFPLSILLPLPLPLARPPSSSNIETSESDS